MSTAVRIALALQSKIVVATRILVFIVLELAMFPCYCGLLIDFFTLPLFSTTIANRMIIYNAAPTIFLCAHWIIGSVFMYHLAS
jgi:E3 ubiquitin-protein ligase MARCH6